MSRIKFFFIYFSHLYTYIYTYQNFLPGAKKMWSGAGASIMSLRGGNHKRVRSNPLVIYVRVPKIIISHAIKTYKKFVSTYKFPWIVTGRYNMMHFLNIHLLNKIVQSGNYRWRTAYTKFTEMKYKIILE